METKVSQDLIKKLKFLKASTEESAREIDDPLESSVEMGVDITLSRSQNDSFGEQLMAQHLGKGNRIAPAEVGQAAGVSPLGQDSLFKPIPRIELKTDEEKQSAAAAAAANSGSEQNILRPNPMIYVNDSELRLSPLSPPFEMDDFPDPSEEVRKILAGKLKGDHNGGGGGDDRRGSTGGLEGMEIPRGSDSRCSTPGGTRSRRESICQLQRLQQQTKMPQLGGKVRQKLGTWGGEGGGH